jgi:isoquinoline 1-oxidoreductase beta subunit
MNAVLGDGVSRREFLRVSTLAGGGMLLALSFDSLPASAQGPPPGVGPGGPPMGPPGASVLEPGVFIRISPDGAIRILSARSEIGQGIRTSSAMTIADELDADWSRVTVEQSPVDSAIYGQQSAGGSRSTPGSWDALRRCGASARAMLVSAAAQTWQVPESECTTAASVVTHAPSGRKLGYGELATRAAALPVPDAARVPLKTRAQYRIIGTAQRNVDTAKIVTGQSLYGVDVQLPGMVYATIVRAPSLRAKPVSGNFDEVKRLPGVRDVFTLEGRGSGGSEAIPGVAIVANSTWAAFSARKALRMEWDNSGSKDSWRSAQDQAKDLSKRRGSQVLNEKGDVTAAFGGAAKTIEAFYTYPFISHATLEPQNATAWLHDGGIEMWAPTQSADAARPSVAQLLGIPVERVTFHLPRIGGGFGRRLNFDYLTEAALIAQRVNGPVKLVWTREDDLQYDYYRAGSFHALKGALDKDGKLLAWQDHIITFSADGKNPVTGGQMDLAEFPLPTAANLHLSQTLLPLTTRYGALRAPRANGVAFPLQGFLHELAVAGGRDHRDLLLDLFAQLPPPTPGAQMGLNRDRAIAVVRLATEKAGWGSKLPRGRGLGLAFFFSHSGHFAEVVDLSVDRSKKITVHKVVVAGDIGLVVNPSGLEQQVQGAVVDGLSAALGQRITIEGGAVQQQNFGDYKMMRTSAAPKEIEVHMVDSGFSPTGAGEPALPPLAPALCNAIHAATGVRIRELPLSLAGYSA